METNASKSNAHVPTKLPSKVLYSVLEKPGDRAYWMKIGVGFTNRDGSLTIRLDALPLGGTLQLRDYQARDEREGREPGERHERGGRDQERFEPRDPRAAA